MTRGNHEHQPSGRLRRLSSARRPPLGAGSTLLVALIAVALVVTVVLAYQAHDASRSHRRVARQTVSDLASAAAWQFASLGSRRVIDLIRDGLAQPVYQAPDASTTPPPLDVLIAAFDGANSCRCVDLERPSTFFRLAGEDLEMRGAQLASHRQEWLTDSLRTILALVRESRNHPGGGILVANDGEQNHAYVYYVHRMREDDPGVVYGWVSDAHEVAKKLLTPVLASDSLLPASLTRGISSDSLFRLEVSTSDGALLLASEGPPRGAEELEGSDSFAQWAGALRVSVFVPESRAAALVLGGLPQSRLPLILLLLVVAGGLLIAAVLLLRQVHRLARLRADFVAGVTHELKTPLAQIRMFVELLSMGRLAAAGESDRALRVIDEESQRLDHLIDNVLGFARLGATASPPASRPVDLDHVLVDVVERFRPLGSERRATVELRVDPGLHAMADRDAVHRIVLNLLDNAVKYGPRGQIVRVDATRWERWARIEVDDQGSGIPDGDRRRIWEPYERLDSRGTTGASGSGIGLAVVRGLVEGHGGRVFVDDAPGGGARFVVLLPLADAGAKGASSGDGGVAGGNGRHRTDVQRVGDATRVARRET